MGRGAQCDGTNVCGCDCPAMVQQQSRGKCEGSANAHTCGRKRSAIRRSESRFWKAMKSTADEVEAAMQPMRFSNGGGDHRRAQASRNRA